MAFPIVFYTLTRARGQWRLANRLECFFRISLLRGRTIGLGCRYVHLCAACDQTGEPSQSKISSSIISLISNSEHHIFSMLNSTEAAGSNIRIEGHLNNLKLIFCL